MIRSALAGRSAPDRALFCLVYMGGGVMEPWGIKQEKDLVASFPWPALSVASPPTSRLVPVGYRSPLSP